MMSKIFWSLIIYIFNPYGFNPLFYYITSFFFLKEVFNWSALAIYLNPPQIILILKHLRLLKSFEILLSARSTYQDKTYQSQIRRQVSLGRYSSPILKPLSFFLFSLRMILVYLNIFFHDILTIDSMIYIYMVYIHHIYLKYPSYSMKIFIKTKSPSEKCQRAGNVLVFWKDQ